MRADRDAQPVYKLPAVGPIMLPSLMGKRLFALAYALLMVSIAEAQRHKLTYCKRGNSGRQDAPGESGRRPTREETRHDGAVRFAISQSRCDGLGLLRRCRLPIGKRATPTKQL